MVLMLFETISRGTIPPKKTRQTTKVPHWNLPVWGTLPADGPRGCFRNPPFNFRGICPFFFCSFFFLERFALWASQTALWLSQTALWLSQDFSERFFRKNAISCFQQSKRGALETLIKKRLKKKTVEWGIPETSPRSFQHHRPRPPNFNVRGGKSGGFGNNSWVCFFTTL